MWGTPQFTKGTIVFQDIGFSNLQNACLDM